MAESGENTPLDFRSDEWVKAEARRLLRAGRARPERGHVAVGSDVVKYEMWVVDAREVPRGRPRGNVLVVVPGHGQTVTGPKKLVATAAILSRSKIAWCIDPVPSRGGDRTEAVAIAALTRQKLDALCGTAAGVPDAAEPPPTRTEGLPGATLIGWSHGGGEALRAAAHDPDLFPQFLGLCPAGVTARHPLELLASFFLEAFRTLCWGLWRREWAYVGDTLRVGLDLLVGLVRDLWRSRSLRQLIEDVIWASRKVVGEAFGYTGEVALLYGREDRAVRWQDLSPGCTRLDDLARCLPAFRRRNFPQVQRLEVQVVEGGHLDPETQAPAFLQTGLGLLGQLDEAQV